MIFCQLVPKLLDRRSLIRLFSFYPRSFSSVSCRGLRGYPSSASRFWLSQYEIQRESCFVKGPHSPKIHCASRSANLNFVWHEIFKKLLRSVIQSFFITIGSCTYILIRLCKYVPCLSFYSFLVLFCIYSVTFRCIFVKLVVWGWRGQDEMAPFFEQLVCVQPIRLRV